MEPSNHYESARHRKDYIVLWADNFGDVRGITAAGELKELYVSYTISGSMPERLPVE